MTDTLPQDPELKFAIDLARLADQTRCHNVVLLDLRRKSPVTKYFLIATGTSDRQRRTVGDELIAHGKLNGFPAWRSNGYETAKWIVVDFVDVVAHVFEEGSRNFYDLEMLWGDCPRVAWQLPQPETAAPSSAPSAASEPLPEITQELEGIMAAPARSDSDVGLDSDVQVGKTGEPQVEEFVDEEILVTRVTDNREPEKTTAVEILAVHAAPSRTATLRKKPKAVAVKPAAKIAGKAAKAAKTKVQVKARTAAPAKMTTSPARRAMPPAVKIARAQAAAGRPTKARKLVKPRAAKPAVKRVKAARPGAKKTAAKKTIAKKISGHQPAAKKTLSRPAAEKRRRTAAKPLKKPAAKTKKR